MVEYWKNGIIGFDGLFHSAKDSTFHYSNIQIFLQGLAHSAMRSSSRIEV
jgi:hypothetical protein